MFLRNVGFDLRNLTVPNPKTIPTRLLVFEFFIKRHFNVSFVLCLRSKWEQWNFIIFHDMVLYRAHGVP
jgi:hypothetical protein